MAEHVWQKLAEGVHSPALDFRKPLLIYWFMSHVIKYVIVYASLSTVVSSTVFVQGARLMGNGPYAHNSSGSLQDILQAYRILDDVLAKRRYVDVDGHNDGPLNAP